MPFRRLATNTALESTLRDAKERINAGLGLRRFITDFQPELQAAIGLVARMEPRWFAQPTLAMLLESGNQNIVNATITNIPVFLPEAEAISTLEYLAGTASRRRTATQVLRGMASETADAALLRLGRDPHTPTPAAVSLKEVLSSSRTGSPNLRDRLMTFVAGHRFNYEGARLVAQAVADSRGDAELSGCAAEVLEHGVFEDSSLDAALRGPLSAAVVDQLDHLFRFRETARPGGLARDERRLAFLAFLRPGIPAVAADMPLEDSDLFDVTEFDAPMAGGIMQCLRYLRDPDIERFSFELLERVSGSPAAELSYWDQAPPRTVQEAAITVSRSADPETRIALVRLLTAVPPSQRRGLVRNLVLSPTPNAQTVESLTEVITSTAVSFTDRAIAAQTVLAAEATLTQSALGRP